MINREAEKKLSSLAKQFKAVALIGPRQSGKTTLVKKLFKNKPYISLENPDTRNFFLNDPKGFFETYKNGAVIDEAQKAPDIFSYLQEILDNSKKKGLFILTGSNNFLLQENISQTLAGRIAYLSLLPFSIHELESKKKLNRSDNEMILKGFYPPVHTQKIKYNDWYPNYIKTYIERDVRQLKNISNLLQFEKFMALLAARCAKELNVNELSNETGVDNKTITSWLSILQTSFIIYLMKPHFKNFNKTIVKRPKLFFYDTGIICSLLGIKEQNHLNTHPQRGYIFENMVINEFVKKKSNKGETINLYYWRDKTGHEIDLLMDDARELIPIEIKSGKTILNEYMNNIKYYKNLSNCKKSFVLYGGDESQKRSNNISIMNWRGFEKIK